MTSCSATMSGAIAPMAAACAEAAFRLATFQLKIRIPTSRSSTANSPVSLIQTLAGWLQRATQCRHSVTARSGDRSSRYER